MRGLGACFLGDRPPNLEAGRAYDSCRWPVLPFPPKCILCLHWELRAGCCQALCGESLPSPLTPTLTPLIHHTQVVSPGSCVEARLTMAATGIVA